MKLVVPDPIANVLRALMLLATAFVLAACGGDGEETAGSTGNGSTVAMTETTDGGNGNGGTDGGNGNGGNGNGGNGNGGNGNGEEATGNLMASPDNIRCSYVPNGSLTGADQLTIFFFFNLIGASPDELAGLVAVQARSDTGLSADLRSAVANDASTAVQLDLRESDFGRTHAVTITVDPANEVNETDESDNVISVSVELPSPRPDTTIGELPCSAEAL